MFLVFALSSLPSTFSQLCPPLLLPPCFDGHESLPLEEALRRQESCYKISNDVIPADGEDFNGAVFSVSCQRSNDSYVASCVEGEWEWTPPSIGGEASLPSPPSCRAGAGSVWRVSSGVRGVSSWQLSSVKFYADNECKEEVPLSSDAPQVVDGSVQTSYHMDVKDYFEDSEKEEVVHLFLEPSPPQINCVEVGQVGNPISEVLVQKWRGDHWGREFVVDFKGGVRFGRRSRFLAKRNCPPLFSDLSTGVEVSSGSSLHGASRGAFCALGFMSEGALYSSITVECDDGEWTPWPAHEILKCSFQSDEKFRKKLPEKVEKEEDSTLLHTLLLLVFLLLLTLGLISVGWLLKKGLQFWGDSQFRVLEERRMESDLKESAVERANILSRQSTSSNFKSASSSLVSEAGRTSRLLQKELEGKLGGVSVYGKHGEVLALPTPSISSKKLKSFPQLPPPPYPSSSAAPPLFPSRP